MGISNANNKPNDSLYTPSWIFEKLGCIFDLDPAHPDHKTDVPTLSYYTEKQDGLNQEWDGFVWLNPPFSQLGVWAEKFIKHNNGIMLCQMSKAKWFWNVWDKADAIVAIPKNVKFVNTEGKNQTIFMPTALIAMGDLAVSKLKQSGIGTVR
jgi:hypothetical protein